MLNSEDYYYESNIFISAVFNTMKRIKKAYTFL